MGAEGDDVTVEVSLVLNAIGQLREGHRAGLLEAQEFFQVVVHGVEGGSDGEDGDDDADHDGDLLLPRGGSD